MKVCHWCEGSGIIGRHMDYDDICPRCDGSGMVPDRFALRRQLRELQRRALASMRQYPSTTFVSRVRLPMYSLQFGIVIKGRRRT